MFYNTDDEIMDAVREFVMFFKNSNVTKESKNWSTILAANIIGEKDIAILISVASYASQTQSSSWEKHVEKVVAFTGFACDLAFKDPGKIFPGGSKNLTASLEKITEDIQPKGYEQWLSCLVFMAKEMGLTFSQVAAISSEQFKSLSL